MQRRRCIKWLKGHTDSITGIMYNCRDEHLASVSIRGDLIIHNLASGTRAAELKDPHEQVSEFLVLFRRRKVWDFASYVLLCCVSVKALRIGLDL